MRMETRVAWVLATLIVIVIRESLTAEPNNAWQYQCEIKQNVTDVLWVLKSENDTELLSRCFIESQRCDQILDDCAIATINSTSSLLKISANLEKEKSGRVGYAEMINGLSGEIRFDAKRNTLNWACGPLKETTDPPTGSDSKNAWEYKCEISQDVTDIIWILQFGNETETLSRCYMESESCDQRLEDCAMATINSTSSLLYISDSLVKQKDGRVGYSEMINDLRGDIRFDAQWNPVNWDCVPLTETTEMFHSTQQTIASTDSPTGSSSKSAWEYQCQINQDVTDILWILQFSDVTETLSRCHVGSERCDQRLEDCAMATINSTSSLLYVSDSLVKQKYGRVGYAEMINGLRGEIRFDAQRNPVNWDCVPLTETTEMFQSTQKTIASTDSTTGSDSRNAWEYQCEINQDVTDIIWILQFGNETETLSRCYIRSENCYHRLEDCAMATINSTSSLLYISDSFLKQKDGRVGYAEIIDGLRGQIRFDATRNPINWACVPITETTQMFP